MTAPRPRQPDQDRSGPVRRGEETGARDARRPGDAQRAARLIGPPVTPAADLDRYVLDLGPAGLLLSSPLALSDVLAALEGAVRAQRAADYAVPERVAVLVDALRRHLAERLAAEHEREAGRGGAELRPSARSESPAAAPWEPPPEVVTVAEAAQLLGIGERRVRKLADAGQLTGRRVGWSWQLDRSAVLRAAEDRREPNP